MVSFGSRPIFWLQRAPRWLIPAVLAAVLAGSTCTGAAAPAAGSHATDALPGHSYVGDDALIPASEHSLLRAEAWVVRPRHGRGKALLMTLGGPVYCVQLDELAELLRASLLCADYGPNGEHGAGTR